MTRMARACGRSRLRSPDDQRVALPPTAAERGRPGAKTSPLELESHREHEACPARSDGMSEGDRAAVDVDALLVQVQHAGRVERDGRKRLVDLHQVEVA